MLQAFARAEKKLKPNWKEMFTEVICKRQHGRFVSWLIIFIKVYDEIPTDLQKQMVDMEKHVEMYKDQYPLKVFISFLLQNTIKTRFSPKNYEQ